MDLSFGEIPGMARARLAEVDARQWHDQARARAAAGQRLLALWGSDERDRDAGFAVWACYLGATELDVLRLAVPAASPRFPDLSASFACAARMQRAVYDLLGVRALGGDTRPWLRHAAWPEAVFPLRREALPEAANEIDDYRFVRVEGEGVHEIGVGPVHAGIIEPGCFRFSVVGEKVLRLEQRLGYTHKGIERRFTELDAVDARRLAARVCGDSAVAYSWAYCMALEGLCGIAPPARALHLRALALERERIANHLGDLGALGNDAGFGFGLSQFSRLKEDLLRLNAQLAGQRYWFDAVVPGGTAFDLDAAQVGALIAQSRSLHVEITRLRDIYGDHAGVQDRFTGCGRIGTELAQRLGLLGFAARASGLPLDLRCDRPHAPYGDLDVGRAAYGHGDVAARVAVRFDELAASLALCERIVASLPPGATHAPLPALPGAAFGIGLVEGWRGPVLVALQFESDGRIRRCHPHDPSWQNWPALEHAVIDNIVPDFPLINKSFNLSYSGQDL